MNPTLERLQHDPVFIETDAATLVVDRDFTIRAVNPAYLAATSRCRDELIGAGLFDAFPDNPDDPAADGVARLSASLETVFGASRRDRMGLQRYDIRAADPEDGFVRRFWNPVNSPVRDDRGRVIGALHRVEDVTTAVDPVLDGVWRPPSEDLDTAWHRLLSALAAEVLGHRRARNTVEQLQQALSSRIVVEQAKGVILAERRCSPEEAFEMLRACARSSNTPIHDLARAVVRDAGGTGKH